MDITEKYIKMSDCPEMQKGWKPAIGDYMVSVFGVSVVYSLEVGVQGAFVEEYDKWRNGPGKVAVFL